jgi:hypothetical protein
LSHSKLRLDKESVTWNQYLKWHYPNSL